MAGFGLRCTECGARFRDAPDLAVCPTCARLREPGGEVRGVLAVDLDQLPGRWPDRGFADPEALAAWWPIAGASSLPRLAVGGTPLLPVERLRAELRMPRLWLKDDSRNPSGSSKDRASLLVVAKARELGRDTVITASTGNAATALAALAAAAGVRAVVLVPAGAPPAKLVQMAAYGATVVPVRGSYDDAYELALAAAERFDWVCRNTAFNPYTVEGKKTLALEVAADLAPDPPDAVLVPAGDGVIAAGVAKGFADLSAAGLIPRLPRLVLVQPEGSAALVRALEAGTETAAPVAAASVADSLVVDVPRNARLCLAEVRRSRGGGVTVSDPDIVAAIARLARLTGVFAEPAAAAVLPGLEAALDRGLADRDERVVLLVTGTGLKDVPAAARGLRLPDPVDPTPDAVARAVQRT